MKRKELQKELASMDFKQLIVKAAELKARLFSLKINSSTGHVKNYAEFKLLRKDIARVFTRLSEITPFAAAAFNEE